MTKKSGYFYRTHCLTFVRIFKSKNNTWTYQWLDSVYGDFRMVNKSFKTKKEARDHAEKRLGPMTKTQNLVF
jgi:hypothetical protein